jgi:hypothetical protein
MKLELENPQFLFFIFPFAFLLLLVYWRQSRSVTWIQKKVSPRFQKDFSVYTPKTLVWQFLLYFIMGCTLIISISNPIQEEKQEIEVKDKGTIIFVLDASLSMLAGDTTVNPITNLKPYDRFATAQDFASDIVDLYPDYKYGLITFSGETSVHSMPIQNPIEIKKLIRSSLVHNFENTGISYLKMFNELHHITESLNESYQVILLSDGEQLPDQKEILDSELEVFAARGIVIHTVGIGTHSPGGSIVFSIVYYDNEKGDENESDKSDKALYKSKESSRKSVITRSTYRQDEILKNISQKTKGKYLVVENGDWVKDLKESISEIKSTTTSKRMSSGKASYSYIPITIFLFLFFMNSFIIFQKDPILIWKKILSKIPGVKSHFLILFLALFYTIHCSEKYIPAILKAHQWNEEGRKSFDKKSYDEAKLYFTKSLSFSVREHIPTFNLGKVYFAQKDFPSAHDKFQKAILLNRDFVDAVYLDGVTLYEWGVFELQPEICDTERAKVLWEQSIVRFGEAIQLSGLFEKTDLYKQNQEYLRSELRRLEELGEDFCEKKSEEKKQEDQKKKEEEKQKEKSSSDQDNSESKDQSGQEGKDGKDSKDKSNDGKDGKDSKDKSNDGKDGKDSKDKSNDGKDGKDSKDKSNNGKDGKDSKDKSNDGKDGKDSKDKSNDGKDGKDSKDKSNNGKDEKDSKDKSNNGKDEKDSKDKSNNGKDSLSTREDDKEDPNSKSEGETNRKKKRRGNASDTLEKRETDPKKLELSEQEKKEIDQALDRLSQKEYKPKLHKRTRHEQSSKSRKADELKKMLEEAYW